ncbi:MAG TPA: hypothetical protein VEZ20_06990 [Allosphingosinicella sp.]|jgi:hypothetical protein|nr:hypothetical protein [Allosphingosinicella sp.]
MMTPFKRATAACVLLASTRLTLPVHAQIGNPRPQRSSLHKAALARGRIAGAFAACSQPLKDEREGPAGGNMSANDRYGGCSDRTTPGTNTRH